MVKFVALVRIPSREKYIFKNFPCNEKNVQKPFLTFLLHITELNLRLWQILVNIFHYSDNAVIRLQENCAMSFSTSPTDSLVPVADPIKKLRRRFLLYGENNRSILSGDPF